MIVWALARRETARHFDYLLVRGQDYDIGHWLAMTVQVLPVDNAAGWARFNFGAPYGAQPKPDPEHVLPLTADCSWPASAYRAEGCGVRGSITKAHRYLTPCSAILGRREARNRGVVYFMGFAHKIAPRPVGLHYEQV
jgi:hypothetical protein